MDKIKAIIKNFIAYYLHVWNPSFSRERVSVPAVVLPLRFVSVGDDVELVPTAFSNPGRGEESSRCC